METIIIITVLITLGAVVLIGSLATLGVVVYKLSKNKLSRDTAGVIEDEIHKRINDAEIELGNRIDELSEDVYKKIDDAREELNSIINSRCDKLSEKIKGK